jgi:outer membrane protein assembly factor BamB
MVIAAVAAAVVAGLLARREEGPAFVTGPNTVVAIDPETNRIVDGVRVGEGPSGVVASGDAVWVANLLDGTVSRVDPDLGEVSRQGQVGTPTAIAVGAGAVWMQDAFNDRLYVIDPQTNAIASSVGVPFFSIETWRDLAELVAKALRKGTTVHVTGILLENRWEDGDGNKRSRIVIRADEIYVPLAVANLNAGERWPRPDLPVIREGPFRATLVTRIDKH